MTDFNAMRDADIKQALQNLSWVAHEVVSLRVCTEMMRMGYELMAPTPSFVVTMEAMFILYSGHDNYTKPDKTLSSVSWRVTRGLFNDPEGLASRIRGIKRGDASFHLLLCIREYISHPSWPPVNCKERRTNIVLDLFAFYVRICYHQIIIFFPPFPECIHVFLQVEQWVIVEKATAERGGVPDRGLF